MHKWTEKVFDMDQSPRMPRFFGYGSLVNLATHAALEARAVRVSGWRRAWRHTGLRDVAFLTAVSCENSEIDGIVSTLPDGDWSDLDAREYAYDRIMLEPHHAEGLEGTAIYAISDGKHGSPSHAHPILLSYLDVVVQGYLDQFGDAGAQAFFETTDGWDAPVLNDRNAPRYPRHQRLTLREKEVVDDALRQFGSEILTAPEQ